MKMEGQIRLLAGAALLAAALPCAAQSYPAKPILMLMPLQAGSAVDVMIRIVAQKMSENMGQQIVIENQPGAAGSIGAERVKRAAPDGYTVGVLNDSILTMIPNIRRVAYDPLKDFVPVGVVAAITWVMVVSNELPAKTVPEFVLLAKSRPGKIDYSSGGNGSPQHVAMEAFKAATGIDVVHIPYRGATQAAVDVMSNRVQAHFGAVSIVLPYIRDGRMRALGVPSAARSPLLPEVPTVAEAGVPGFEWRTWASFVVPLATPGTIVERLNAEMVKAVSTPEVRERLIAQGLEPIGSPPATLTQWTQDGLKRMRDIVQRAKIQAE
ncbi:MAG: tripartite tricarboxylate transporter substrate binding protein [Betaproteobacteria bacterium]|nr:MAG: tripartite tricarboxylate transporter substrate binding protein [Betaproteobacteria bacterium]